MHNNAMSARLFPLACRPPWGELTQARLTEIELETLSATLHNLKDDIARQVATYVSVITPQAP